LSRKTVKQNALTPTIFLAQSRPRRKNFKLSRLFEQQYFLLQSFTPSGAC